jgi:phosphatidylserine decarboxylase
MTRVRHRSTTANTPATTTIDHALIYWRPPVPLADYVKAWPQYLLPQHALSALAHRVTRIRHPALKNRMIEAFIRRFGVDMSEAEAGRAEDFEHFNAFFTRALREGARPLPGDEALCASPVDGAISEIGTIDDDRLLQAKGRRYTIAALLGGDLAATNAFRDGSFATLYLSPRDYHRIHMPCAGTLTSMAYIPGDLFSVNAATTRQVDGLFARNERVVCHFDTPWGRLVLVMGGAIFGGGIETVWSGPITPAAVRAPRRWDYSSAPRSFVRGEEFARFNMGSTVVMLAQRGRLQWLPGQQAGEKIRQGEALGRFA